MWSKWCHRSSVSEVRTMTGLQGPAGYRQGTIDRVGTSVGANGIALARLREGSNDRTTLERIAVTPHNRAGVGTKWPGVRGQNNVLLALLLVRDQCMLLTGLPYPCALSLCKYSVRTALIPRQFSYA